MKTSIPHLQVALLVALSASVSCNGPIYKTQVEVQSSTESPSEELTTQTVYGFLDFTTTIGNTVMGFSPQSQKAEIKPTPTVTKIEATKPPAVEVKTQVQVKVSSKEPEQAKIVPTKAKSEEPKPKKLSDPAVTKKKPVAVVNKVEGGKETVVSSKQVTPAPSKHVVESIQDAMQEDNNLEDLSKAPSDMVSETFKVIGVDSTVKSRSEPTGLVTNLEVLLSRTEQPPSTKPASLALTFLENMHKC
uniref:Uncharacterized protein n=1 Tax=Lygus hesperus TaxID=30085 RepID=A0A0A9WX01_LYGHE